MAKAASFDAKKSQNDANAGGDAFDQILAPGFDDPFNLSSNEISASFVGVIRSGNPALQILPTAAASNELASNHGVSASEIVQQSAIEPPVLIVGLGGVTFNLTFSSAAWAAPESFRAGIEQAATLLAATITDHITVNLSILYAGTGGGAVAAPPLAFR